MVLPIINRLRWQLVTARNHARMLAQDVAPDGIGPKAGEAIGDRHPHAVPIAFRADQAPLGNAGMPQRTHNHCCRDGMKNSGHINVRVQGKARHAPFGRQRAVRHQHSLGLG